MTSDYTSVRIINQDDPSASFTLKMPNAEITGNHVKYKVENGKVYKFNGKTNKYELVRDNSIKLTRYQATGVQVAARGDDKGQPGILNWDDLTGARYGYDLNEALKKAKSEYLVLQDDYESNPYYKFEADASEHGVFTAFFQSKKDDNQQGKLQIKLNDSTIWHGGKK